MGKPPTCAAPNCWWRGQKSRKQGITIHKFPADLELRRQWQVALKLDQPELLSPTMHICSRHFQEDDFNQHGNKRTLKKGVVPSVFNAMDEDDLPPQEPNHVKPRKRSKGTIARMLRELSKAKRNSSKAYRDQAYCLQVEAVQKLRKEKVRLYSNVYHRERYKNPVIRERILARAKERNRRRKLLIEQAKFRASFKFSSPDEYARILKNAKRRAAAREKRRTAKLHKQNRSANVVETELVTLPEGLDIVVHPQDLEQVEQTLLAQTSSQTQEVEDPISLEVQEAVVLHPKEINLVELTDNTDSEQFAKIKESLNADSEIHVMSLVPHTSGTTSKT